MTPEELLLLEQVVSAHRERTVDGVIKSHPAWHDLDAAGRVAAFDETMKQRTLERSADRDGRSSTVKAVLARLTR
ncbi:MAG: hypothetical protein GQE15_15430 [Archangiaceae bacterium]|nr:hypothetical protein [Archangiaceae bacterium]